MIVRWFLLETKIGLWLIARLEQKTGLAVVSADWLGRQPGGWLVVADQAQ